MRITACYIGKRSIISFVIFGFILFSGCFYLTRPAEAMGFADQYSQETVFSDIPALTEAAPALYISNAEMQFVGRQTAFGSNDVNETVLRPASFSGLTAGAASVLEACFREALIETMSDPSLVVHHP